MSNWFETLEGMHSQVWDTLIQGVVDPAHPARRPTLATVSPDNWPEARMVVLRGSDSEAAMVWVHTDLQSDKIRSLQATPRAALHVWDADQALQIRMQAAVHIESGPAVRPIWDNIPDHSKQSYGLTPPPGTAIDASLAYTEDPDPETFAVLHCQIMHIDALHLGQDHRRCSFSRARQWQGQWLSP
ncbi:MAG: pyridoxamine 5'-phosphate oxidase family protein [Pseudomonadota bacterium]